jgi:hypothetical protein
MKDNITRVDLCHSEDEAAITRLREVIAELGGWADEDWHESPLGVGLQRIQFDDGELTVFADAWGVDIAGPDRLVRKVLAAMAGL